MKSSITIKATLLAILSSASIAGVASAQNQPTNEEIPLNPFAPRPVEEVSPLDPSTDQPPAEVPVEPVGEARSQDPGQPVSQPAQPYSPEQIKAMDESIGPDQPEETTKKKSERILVKHPFVLAAPTAHLLPAAVIYSSTSLDTGGGFSSRLRVGLGDVGEFGVETTDRVRFIPAEGLDSETIQPLVLATFKMGVGEDRLFENQPAVALGFRKSFETSHDDFDIRVAAVELMASKTLGPVSLHAGGVFWDASMDSGFGENAESVVLHDFGKRRQIRPVAGLVAEPFHDSQLMIDLYWVPRFDPTQDLLKDKISLRPALSWGVRYKVGRSVSIESGVRIPDIGEANLLDAQIFGQLTFSSTKLRDVLGVGE